MGHAESLYPYIVILKNEPRLPDLLGLNPPALIIRRLLAIEPVANVLFIGLKHLVRHVFGALRTEQFQW